ncbi:MAG: Holliday junction resolvase RuvX [Candidatus Latescibacteria bacterium]|nr:Holliday junction resolvase RuvX [Candidatus Latescibacterota bacterium]
MPRRTRSDRPKVRRLWVRKPVTQVQPDRQRYDRQREQAGARREWDAMESNIVDDQRNEAMPQAPAGRVLGIDYGLRRVGLAISDPTGRIAHGLETLDAASQDAVQEAIRRIGDRYDIRKVIVGLPVNMDGTMGESTGRVVEFVQALSARTDAQVITWDERLTSHAAQRAMIEMGRSLKGRKKDIDRISATLILQGYLDSVRQVQAATSSATEERTCD